MRMRRVASALVLSFLSAGLFLQDHAGSLALSVSRFRLDPFPVQPRTAAVGIDSSWMTGVPPTVRIIGELVLAGGRASAGRFGSFRSFCTVCNMVPNVHANQDDDRDYSKGNSNGKDMAIERKGRDGFLLSSSSEEFLRFFMEKGEITEAQFNDLVAATKSDGIDTIRGIPKASPFGKFTRAISSQGLWDIFECAGQIAERSLSSIEAALGGNRYAFDPSKYLPDAPFVEKAVRVNSGLTQRRGSEGQAGDSIPNRREQFSLVMGSSGSGKVRMYVASFLLPLIQLTFLRCCAGTNTKSMFSYNQVATEISNDGKDTFTLMACFGDIFGNTDWDELSNPNVEFKNNFIEENRAKLSNATRDFINMYLADQKSEYSLSIGQQIKDSVRLVLVLDESGDARNRVFFGEQHKISLIRILGGLGSIAKDYHAVFAGTGLDTMTSHYVSNIDAIKFRMRPWSLDAYENYVKARFGRQGISDTILDISKSSSTLMSLTTNARCASFLAEAIKAAATPGQQQCSSRLQLSSIIASVVARYIENNGLRKLELPHQKEAVVRAVLRGLDVVTKKNENEELAFPDFLKELRSGGVTEYAQFIDQCWSIVDINMESRKGVVELVDPSRPPMTISPALAVVLTSLVGSQSMRPWNWSELEVEACIVELMYGIRKSDRVDKDNLWEFLVASSQIPGAASDSVNVPAANCINKVILNGEQSAFADVIAPYNLGQVKFVEDGTVANIDMLEELCKMGLTKSTWYKRQQTVLGFLLSSCWDSSSTKTAATNLVNPSTTSKKVSNGPLQNDIYPFGRVATDSIKNMGKMPVERLLIPEQNPAESSTNSHLQATKATFYTNAGSFSIPAISLERRRFPSLVQLAKKLGISDQQLYNFEYGLSVDPEGKDEHKRKMLSEWLSPRIPGSNESFVIGQSDVNLDGSLKDPSVVPIYIKDQLRIGVEGLRFRFFMDFD